MSYWTLFHAWIVWFITLLYQFIFIISLCDMNSWVRVINLRKLIPINTNDSTVFFWILPFIKLILLWIDDFLLFLITSKQSFWLRIISNTPAFPSYACPDQPTFLFVDDVETTEKNESSLPCVVPCFAFSNFLIPFRILSSLKGYNV